LIKILVDKGDTVRNAKQSSSNGEARRTAPDANRPRIAAVPKQIVILGLGIDVPSLSEKDEGESSSFRHEIRRIFSGMEPLAPKMHTDLRGS
jgi:hypothetical protein